MIFTETLSILAALSIGVDGCIVDISIFMEFIFREEVGDLLGLFKVLLVDIDPNAEAKDMRELLKMFGNGVK